MRSPCRISVFEMKSGMVISSYESNGEEISAGSTGLSVGDHLYIGQVFRDYLLKV
ncbi:MAG: hypothetical protein IPL46_01830 [Saprospiraceae bacterium]|nr:hypothetical protein [Saprospiraceae bacterium]